MLIDETVIYEKQNTPLIALAGRDLHVEENLIHECRRELFMRPEGARAEGFASGYLLGVEECRAAYPKASSLLNLLRERVVAPYEGRHGVRFNFSFIKTAEGAPPASTEGIYFEGVHLDSHPGVGEGLELFRLLINLSSTPRLFKYAETDWRELRDAGVGVGRAEFKRLSLPEEVTEKVISVPGRMAGSLSVLKFWASVVPHVGLNDDAGSFLVSFEALADFSRVRVAESAPTHGRVWG